MVKMKESPILNVLIRFSTSKSHWQSTWRPSRYVYRFTPSKSGNASPVISLYGIQTYISISNAERLNEHIFKYEPFVTKQTAVNCEADSMERKCIFK